MIDVTKLKAKMIECGETQESLAPKANMHVSTLNKKMHGIDGRVFNVNEVRLIALCLRLTGSEVLAIFFPQFLAEKQRNFA